MRQGSNSGRRPRGRTNRKQHGGGGGGQSRTHTFDSNGPDGRVRGNARQVYEKYLTLARDATSAGDRVAAEAYYQHAEHYFRILSDSTDPQAGGRRQEERQPQQSYNGADGEEANGNAVAAAEDAAKNNGAVLEAQQPAAERPGAEQPEVSQPGAEQPEIGGAPAPVAAADGQNGEGEAPQKPRRSRARKPRASEDGKPRKKEASSESENDPAVP
ncbi:DUF4167 domain-containing protein [Pelagibius sp. CAU 1746]|uniref:DUF4167 domain-containing protein n=1 Tax=Pelagibius sp. CAU 1746 TaxID=3140370 RepID=UPI00325AFA0E